MGENFCFIFLPNFLIVYCCFQTVLLISGSSTKCDAEEKKLTEHFLNNEIYYHDQNKGNNIF